ncbi:MAG: thioredoxin family protein [Gammaproteobacteria bacterium]|nr:thioredoxin family protein [Gammaproteobacteria bacterium]
MKLELLVSEDCRPCARAQALWASVCADQGLELAVIRTDSAHGRATLGRHRLEVLPVLLVDDRPVAIGVPSREEALALVSSGFPRLR